eukprot:1091420-Amphidinium_carterae.2
MRLEFKCAECNKTSKKSVLADGHPFGHLAWAHGRLQPSLFMTSGCWCRAGNHSCLEIPSAPGDCT